MTTIDQSALLPYSVSQLFELVNDIESYPEFMEGCIGAEILSQQEEQVTARLELGKAGLRYAFTTRNLLTPSEKIKMVLVEGPFSEFSATWIFKALGQSACKISLQMSFAFSSDLVDTALKHLFVSSSRNMVNAICKQAEMLYG